MTMFLALYASTFSQKVSKQHSRSLFRATIVYLPLVLIAMMFHRRSTDPQTYSWNDLKSDLTHLTKLKPQLSDSSLYHKEDLDDIQTDYHNIKNKVMMVFVCLLNWLYILFRGCNLTILHLLPSLLFLSQSQLNKVGICGKVLKKW